MNHFTGFRAFLADYKLCTLQDNFNLCFFINVSVLNKSVLSQICPFLCRDKLYNCFAFFIYHYSQIFKFFNFLVHLSAIFIRLAFIASRLVNIMCFVVIDQISSSLTVFGSYSPNIPLSLASIIISSALATTVHLSA